ncbi:MAG: polymer-forming cytoskeletal protein, partial [Hyphomicrobium sp.]
MAFMRQSPSPPPSPFKAPETKLEPPPQPAKSGLDGSSVIGSDLTIEGPSITMRCKGSLRIDGNIEANLHCVELVIGEQ